MSETTHYIPENHSVDWRALADDLFPVDALKTAPAVNALVIAGSRS
jgi:hypothetical protein